jgi:hypothetical protein
MRRYVLLFISTVLIIFTACNQKNKTDEAVLSSGERAKPIVLESKYDSNTDHAKEKKLIRKRIKKIDTVINYEFDNLKDWVSNVGEAMDIME